MNQDSAVLKLLEGISVHGAAAAIVNEHPGKGERISSRSRPS